MISQYQLTSLPNPPDRILKQIDDALFNFMWDNKRAKIKRNQLYCDLADGGLSIPNIYIHSKTLKLKWLKFINDNTFISEIYFY